MPPRNIRPMIGERQLVPDEQIPRQPLDLSSRPSFLQIAQPEYWGLVPENYGDISEQMIAVADPLRFRKDLIGVPTMNKRPTGYSVGFQEAQGPYTRVALTPAEYKLIARAPTYIHSAASSRVLASQVEVTPGTRDVDKGNRAGRHQLESLLEGMNSYSDTLSMNKRILERFIEATKFYWLNRGKQMNMVEDLQSFRAYILPNMFEAVRYQRGWSDTQEDLAKRSLDVRLFFKGDVNMRLREEWPSLFSVLAEYNGYKTALFKDRIYQTEKKIKDTQTE